MQSSCKYLGELIILPLRGFVKVGKGDDVEVVVDHETNSHYGCLDIDWYSDDYEMASNQVAKEALIEYAGEPVMIAVEDPESGSPMILTKCVMRDGEKHFLAVIFNAEFSHPEENRHGSYCLRMSPAIDPNGVFSERIMFAPGEKIAWDVDQLAMLG